MSNTEHDYLEIGSKMAQALQDIIGETCAAENCPTTAESCRTHATDLGALVDEWEALYSQSDLEWQKRVMGDGTSLISTL